MSKIALTPNASGTGTLTIAAPNTSTDRTITLPDETGSIITTGSSGKVIPSAALPAGSVLQVVNSWSMTQESTTSTSFVASSYIKASITPSSASSKVFVIVNGGGVYSQVNASRLFTTIYRDGTTNLGDANYGLSRQQVSASYVQPISIHLLDSPSTTSSTEYKVYFRCHDGNTVYLSFGDSGRTNITLMEIAA